MPVTISDDSVNALAEMADIIQVVEPHAVDLYARLLGRRVTDAEATDATIQSIYHLRGFVGAPEVPLVEQRLRPNDYITRRILAEIRSRP